MAEIGSDILKASALLRNGEIIAIPTETVYGLAANAFNTRAVARIFEIKSRPYFDPLIVHSHSIESIEREIVKEFPKKAKKLAEKFWPGPLTLVLPKHSRVPDIITSGLPTVGVRIPNHRLTLSLLKFLDFPLAAPSANPFGYISPTTASHVDSQLGIHIPYILDGGSSKVGIESTIVGFDEMQRIKIYRYGGIPIEQIEEVVGESILHNQNVDQIIKAPGMLKSHYSPKIRLQLVDELNETIARQFSKKTAFITYKSKLKILEPERNKVLSHKGDLKEAAANLFTIMRELDNGNYELIVAEKLPNTGLGIAINDRLFRASQLNEVTD